MSKVLLFPYCFFVIFLSACLNEKIQLKTKNFENSVRIFSSHSLGLLNDVNIYKRTFESRVGNVELVRVNKDKSDGIYYSPNKNFILNIFMERVYDLEATKNAIQNWLMINQEWVEPPERLLNIDVVLCKSIIAYEMMKKYKEKYKMKFKIYYTKFTSDLDVINDFKKDYNLALHAAGRSHLKNTQIVLNTWLKNPTFPKLKVTCRNFSENSHDGCFSYQARPVLMEKGMLNKDKKGVYAMASNLTIYSALVSSEELVDWQNQSGYYVVPSAVEGYGHTINEGRAKGAVVITTDKSPMNELVLDGVTGFLVPANKCETINHYTGAQSCKVSSRALADVVKRAMALSEEEKHTMGKKAQEAFLADRAFFEERMRMLIELLLKNGNLEELPLIN